MRRRLATAAGVAPLAGFWMGGYEGADHTNAAGVPLDMARASGHIARLDEDHRRARQAGLAVVRESIGWRLSEGADGRIDLARAQHIAASARRHGLQVVWTLMHYGVPDGLSLHDDRMIERFARFAAEVARRIGLASAAAPVVNPVNEISFLAWAASQRGLLAPPNGLAADDPAGAGDASHVSGYAVKRRLAQAVLAAMAAMRAVDPRTRFLHIDPVVHAVAPPDRPDLADHAALVRSWQWQAWDLLAGRAEPALGGHPEALDLIGLNHYHSSQWEVGSEHRLDWHGRDPRRLPLATLLHAVWQRYQRPMVLAETSHVGQGRAAWLHDVADQVRGARQDGLPVLGLCLYPLTDRPDWNQPASWHRSGLWHVPHVPAAGPSAPARAAPRLGDQDYLQALQRWQPVLPGPPPVVGDPRPPLLAFTHLRWSFVRHRSHQLLSRLARHWRVVVVEEPMASDGPARLDRQALGPQLEVLVPHLPGGASGFDPALHPALHGLLATWWQQQGLAPALAWISTPMALPLAQALPHRALVYDCADELAGFLNPPPGLAALEDAALRQADLVLVAGAALAAPRGAAAGPRLRLLPNGADVRHFRRHPPLPGSWEAEEAVALRLQGPAGGPQLGHAGVIDERIDLALLAALADARPQWQLVMLGPVVKIDPLRLPRRPNLHWLGERHHRLLPALMAPWRAALLPFVATLATRHASPLKLLEALAAGLPVAATGLPGVRALCAVADVAGRVRLVAPHAALADWLAACDAAMADHRPAPALPTALHWPHLARVADRLLRQLAGVATPARSARRPAELRPERAAAPARPAPPGSG